VPPAAPPQIKVSRWNGTTWTTLPPIANAENPRISPTSNNRFFLAYNDTTDSSIKVRRWNGSAWVNLGSGIANSFLDDLELDALARPVVAYRERVAFPPLLVKRWNSNTFVSVGTSVEEICKCGQLSLIVQGNVMTIAYHQINILRVRRYDATTNRWVQTGSSVYNGSNLVPNLAIRPNGDPVIAWHGPTEGLQYPKVFVKDWSPTPITPPSQ
jgi:hypothetical protein